MKTIQDSWTRENPKKLHKKTIVQLVYIFNSCLKLQHFPGAWKQASQTSQLLPRFYKSFLYGINLIHFVSGR